MRSIFGCILVAVALMTGCSDSGNEYVGKWVKVSDEKSILVIERNGESFIIRDTHPDIFLGRGPQTENIPATFKDGMLQVHTELGTESLVIDKASGNLINGRNEYKKAK